MTDYNKVKKFASVIILFAFVINGIYLITKYENTNYFYVVLNLLLGLLLLYRFINLGIVLFKGAKNHIKGSESIASGFMRMFRNIFLFIFLPAIILTLILILAVGPRIK